MTEQERGTDNSMYAEALETWRLCSTTRAGFRMPSKFINVL